MLIKATLLGVLIASTPLYLVSMQGPQDGEPAPDDGTPTLAPADDLRPELELLRGEHADALRELDAERARADRLQAQLEHCMDFLLQTRERRSSCRPSRRMMTHYQWMRQNGHDAHAQKALAHVVEQLGDDNNRLNRAAWHLMTDEETAGQYDELALALAERMQQNSGLDHRMLDTVALARFLNGHVDEAIALQKQAIEEGGRSDDYRRRLRTYEAGKKGKVEEETAEPNEEAVQKPRRKISD